MVTKYCIVNAAVEQLTVKRETSDPVAEPSQVAAAASQTDEDVTVRELLEQLFQFNLCLAEMIYQFLTHTIDVQRKKLLDKLFTINVLSADERERIKKQKINSKVQVLMKIMRTKSAAEFDSFLITVSETGQQSVTDVVRQALRAVGQTGHNPLQHLHGKTVYSVIDLGL